MPTPPTARAITAFLAAICVLWPAIASAQDTREGIIIAQQTDKAAHPPPETRTKPEIVLGYVGKFLTPKPRGFFPVFDSVYAGGSLTLGGGYGWAYGDKGTFAVRGLYSIKNYKLFDVLTTSPGHMNGHLTLFGTAGWRNATDAAFYGLGMGASLADRSDFDLKETYARGNAELRPNDWSVFKGSVGLEAYEIGPSGKNDHSIEGSLTPEEAPGLGADPDLHPLAGHGRDRHAHVAGLLAQRRLLRRDDPQLHEHERPVRFQPRRGRSHSAHPDPARDVGPLVPRQGREHSWQRHERHAVFPAALARQRQLAAGVHELALPGSEFAADAGRVPLDPESSRHGHGRLLRRGQGGAAVR